MSDSTSPVPDNRLLTLREAAAQLAVSDRFIRSLISAGRLRCVRLGRAVRIDPRDVTMLIERAKAGR